MADLMRRACDGVADAAGVPRPGSHAQGNVIDAAGLVPSVIIIYFLVPSLLAHAAGSWSVMVVAVLALVLLFKRTPQMFAHLVPASGSPGAHAHAHAGRRAAADPSRPAADPDASAGVLRALSLNCFLLPPGQNHLHSNLNDCRVREISRIIADYDIVLLQEVASAFSGRRNAVLRAGLEAGLAHYVLPKPPPFLSPKICDAGLVIMSRYPITREGHLNFSCCVAEDHLMQKGATYARVEVARGQFLDVFNTHLQSCYSLIHEDALDVQQVQVRELAGFVGRMRGPGGAGKQCPAILAGDFNLPRDCDCDANAEALAEPFAEWGRSSKRRAGRAGEHTAAAARDTMLAPARAAVELLAAQGMADVVTGPTISVLYDLDSQKEIATTHAMCGLCTPIFEARPRTLEFQAGVDRFFVGKGDGAGERRVAGWDAHVFDPPISCTDHPACLRASDHRGLELRLAWTTDR